MKTNKQPELTAKAKRLAFFIRLLFQDQNLSGKLTQASRGARHLSLAVRLSRPAEIDKALNLAEALALASHTKNVLAQRQAGYIVYQFELKSHFWQSYTRQDLPGNEAIGLAERKQPVNFTFEQPHTLVAGSTNSGKSETIKSILLSLMTSYRPEELGIILLDLHGDYSDFENEAHLIRFDYGSIATSQDEISEALSYCNQVLAHRKANTLKDDKRLVLVLDEADKVLQDDDRKEIVRAISQEGRKFGLHVIVGTQKPSHKELPHILDNLLNRFVGLVSDAKVSANLTGRSGLQAHLLTGSGDFIHTCALDVQRFQVALCTQQDFNGLERAEVAPVKVESSDVIELPTELPDRTAGRPKLELNPEYVAWYLFHYPEKVSRNVAKELADISRDAHDLNSRFAQEVIEAYLKLQSQRLQLGA